MAEVQIEAPHCTLSVVIPCYNEAETLEVCVQRVLAIQDSRLDLEIIIVDDASADNSVQLARSLADRFPQIQLFQHTRNQGKGAALKTGFKHATGDYVAVQDADLEYDPNDLKRLLEPLRQERADVVFGSRFLSCGSHRVLYFWHYLGNRFLTFLSNMFTDLNLTDMEVCYKVFKNEVIQAIEIQEARFGFEPEIVAKVAHMRLRIYEMGISYDGRTYAQGKKIGVKDGFRALYCIFRYNAYRAPLPVQFLIYLFIGGTAALTNLMVFLGFLSAGQPVMIATLVAFGVAAAVNYLLCIAILFRHKARFGSVMEIGVYIALILVVAAIDLLITKTVLGMGAAPAVAKLTATAVGLALNFLGRRFIVFAEPSTPTWRD